MVWGRQGVGGGQSASLHVRAEASPTSLAAPAQSLPFQLTSGLGGTWGSGPSGLAQPGDLHATVPSLLPCSSVNGTSAHEMPRRTDFSSSFALSPEKGLDLATSHCRAARSPGEAPIVWTEATARE